MKRWSQYIKKWRAVYLAIGFTIGNAISKVRRIWLVTGIGLLVIVGFATWFLAARNHSPLPLAIRQQATFPLYYPFDTPGNFVPDTSHASYDAGTSVFMVPLNGPNGHQAILTEQSLPKGLTFDNLTGQGKVLDKIDGQAVLNDVEGRIVASMISPDRKTLILINSSNSTNNEMITIVRSLRPTN